jgi:hypothetical protein
MAATDECSVNHLLCQDAKNNTEQEEKCLCCAKLRLELQKARTEILSYEKIIKFLQEELSNSNSLNTTVVLDQNDTSVDLRNDQQKKEDWVQVTAKKKP